MPQHPRLESRGHALLLTRRALTQSLIGLPERHAWSRPASATFSIGEVTREVWRREAYWLWPPELPAPRLEERPDVVGLLYALLRHRAVTEELLMRSSDADLDRVYVSEARLEEGAEPRPLGAILDTIIRGELYAAVQTATLRCLQQPDWPGIGEAWDAAAEAALGPRDG